MAVTWGKENVQTLAVGQARPKVKRAKRTDIFALADFLSECETIENEQIEQLERA